MTAADGADTGRDGADTGPDDAGARPEASRRFLSDADAATLAALVDRIFPDGDGLPAASELGVVDYIDGQLAGPWGAGERLYREGPHPAPADAGHGWQLDLAPAEAYVQGLESLRRAAFAMHWQPFERLEPAVQDDVLRAMETGALGGFDAIPAPAFFELVHANAIEGVFSDPRHGGNRDAAAWRWIGYPT